MTVSLTDDERSLKLKEEGNKAFREKRYHAAVKSYTESLEVQPTFVVFGNRAQAYIYLGLYELALRDVNEAIRLSNTHAKNLYRRAKILTKLGFYELARSDYQRIIELNGDEKEKEAVASLINLRGRVNARTIELRQWDGGDEFEYSEMIKIPIADDFPVTELTSTTVTATSAIQASVDSVADEEKNHVMVEYEWPSERSPSPPSAIPSEVPCDRTSNSSFSSTLSNTLPPSALSAAHPDADAAHARSSTSSLSSALGEATASLRDPSVSSSASITSSTTKSSSSAQTSSHNTTFESLSGTEDDDAFVSADTSTPTREDIVAKEEPELTTVMVESELKTTTVAEVQKKVTVDGPTVANASVPKETAIPSVAPVATLSKETTVPKRKLLSLPPPLNFVDFALHYKQLEQTPAQFAEYFLAIPPATYPSVFANLFQNDHLETLIDGYQLLLEQGSITTTSVAESLIGLSYLPRFDLLPMFMGDKEKQNALNLIDKLSLDVATYLRSVFD